MKPQLLLGLVTTFFTSIATARLFTAVFTPPGNITSFTSYLSIPPISKSPNTPSGAQSIYTALQPSDSVVLAQIPIVNQLGGTAWMMDPTWCCDKNVADWVAPKILVPSITVHPGELIYTSQSLTPATSTWFIGWADGGGNANPIVGGSVALPAYQSLSGPFTKVIFGLDIADGASWDFGAVTWSNIQIVVATQSTAESWCVGVDSAGGPIRNNVNYAIAGREMNRTGDQQTCIIQSLVLNMPVVTGA